MAVAGVGVERDVGDEAELREFACLIARQALADEVLLVERLGAAFVLQGWPR